MNSNFRSEETLIAYGIDKSSETLPLLRTKGRNIPYPKGVHFVLASKFFEAFAANGVRTILVLYLRDALFFTESFSTIMLHVFNFFSQFCPIFGAILADCYVGNANTITYFLYLYSFGWIGFIVTAFPIDGIPILMLISLSLLFISIGNGSIRACVTTLGAIQFQVPEQNRQLDHYFSNYYFIYYIGIFLSKILPPLVRAETKCFGKVDCYPAVFGVLGAAFFIAALIIQLGKYFYKSERPSDQNIVLQFCGCIKYAIKDRLKHPEHNKTHWLHHSIGQYSREFVYDMIKFLNISKLFLPLPIYYAILAQQDSSWTFQASQMDTNLFGFKIEPDQAKAMGPIFLFLMIPLWQYIIYPLMVKCGLHIHPLHSVAVGGICAALSFVCSGLLQLQIEFVALKTVNIAWQIPQFILLMMGELFLSIPGLQFAFKQAPPSMKSVLTAAWFLNNAIGNLIVVIITKLGPVDLQSSEYFVYAFLMFMAMIIFTTLACDYLKEVDDHVIDSDKNHI